MQTKEEKPGGLSPEFVATRDRIRRLGILARTVGENVVRFCGPLRREYELARVQDDATLAVIEWYDHWAEKGLSVEHVDVPAADREDFVTMVDDAYIKTPETEEGDNDE